MAANISIRRNYLRQLFCMLVLLTGATNVMALQNTMEWPITDFTKTAVDFNEILSGGPPKDGIPAVDKPKFVSVSAAAAWLDAKEPVVFLQVNGEVKAYPIQILMYHEIVNDRIGDVPVTVTFCPLCNASIVFKREIAGKVYDFGTTGRLRKSDLVMYDRQTESWWQQFTGKAIIGSMLSTELERIPSTMVAFEDLQRAWPDATVLSTDTGHSRPYGHNPYRGYDNLGDHPFLFRDPVDPRLPAMERVLNVSFDKVHRLYPFAVLQAKPVINDVVSNVPIVVLSKEGTLSALDEAQIRDSRTIPSAAAFERNLDNQELNFVYRDGKTVDQETGSEWNIFGQAVAGKLKGSQLISTTGGVHFAFAWLAFNPDSEIYK